MSSRLTRTILVAPNAFKECLSPFAVCRAIERGIHQRWPEANVISVPLGDGGDQTLAVLVGNAGDRGRFVRLNATDPLGQEVQTEYGLIDSGKTAVIEMAQISGLWRVPEEKKNPLLTSTFGTGQLMKDALDNGVEKILLCIGGSATNDGGIGLANALGVKFFDDTRNLLDPIGENLRKIKDIIIPEESYLQRIRKIEIEVACDVVNPLLGPNGATYIYGPQKGADAQKLEILEEGLENLSKVCYSKFGVDHSLVEGSGAAGGLGFGLMTFCDAKLVPGFELVAKQTQLEKAIRQADLVITGEGEVNESTDCGKVIGELNHLCTKHGVPCVCLVGAITGQPNYPITAFSIQNRPMTLQNSIDRADELLELGASQVASFYRQIVERGTNNAKSKL